MKKSSAKKTASKAAPAKKSAPVASKAPVASVPVSKKTPATPAPAPQKVSAVPAVPAVKKTAPKAIVTTISARIDVGFGNTLYVRGEGPGLSWDKGVVMECTGDDQWTLKLGESARPIIFKFLHNDEVWSIGEDYAAKSGTTVAFSPIF